jgi:hypothetical protein
MRNRRGRCLLRPNLALLRPGPQALAEFERRSTHVERATDAVEELDEEGILAFAERVLSRASEQSLCGASGPVVLLCERRLAKRREELVEAIQWNRLRRGDLDAQRSA